MTYKTDKGFNEARLTQRGGTQLIRHQRNIKQHEVPFFGTPGFSVGGGGEAVGLLTSSVSFKEIFKHIIIK